MGLEIEAKLKIDSPGEVRRVLDCLDGELVGTVIQTDHYFDDEAGTLKASDRALRIRLESGEDGKAATIVTFKGAKKGGSFKVRRELESRVESCESLSAIFSALGFSERFVIQKSRQLWRFEDCHVCIDRLPLLGWFVEIEGESEEKVASVQQQLALGGLSHIRESYLCLLEERMKEAGLSKTEILLEDSGL